MGTDNRSHAGPGLVIAVAIASTLTATFIFVPSAVAAPRPGHRHATVRSTDAAQFAEPGFPASPAAAPPFAVGVLHVSYTDPTRGTDARGDVPAAATRTIAVT